MKIIWYGLLFIPSNRLLGFSTMSNPEDGECIGVMFTLDLYSDNIWLVSKQEIAERARTTNTSWYNAGYNSPENTFNSKDLKVVQVEIEVK